MQICECGHHMIEHLYQDGEYIHGGACRICGCPKYKPRHDPRYDPDDVGDIGYSDEGHPYSGMGKVRR